MNTIVEAIFENGVLRPTMPLALAEGERVNVLITPLPSRDSRLRAPTHAEGDYARRIGAARSLEEMHAVMASAPPSPDDDIDIPSALDASRRLTGFREPDSESAGENPR